MGYLPVPNSCSARVLQGLTSYCLYSSWKCKLLSQMLSTILYGQSS